MLYKFQEYIKEAKEEYSSDEVAIMKQYFLDMLAKKTPKLEKTFINSLKDIGNIFDTESHILISEYVGVSKNLSGDTSGQFWDGSDFVTKTSLSDRFDDEDLKFTFNDYQASYDIKRCFTGLLNGHKPSYTFTCLLEPLVDASHDMSMKRNERYLNNNLLQVLKPEYTCKTLITYNKTESNKYWYKVLTKILDIEFEFVNPLNSKNCLAYIKKNPKSLNTLAKYLSKKTLYTLINKNPSYKDYLDTQSALDYIKHNKSKTNPERRNMEKDSQMYAFALKPSFKEDKDGRYTKDIEIERMVPIDPYDAKDGFTLNMMKLRARTQGDTEVYCVWLPKDAYSERDLDKINDDEYTYLRKSIDGVKQKI